jgi:hypothetical protein
VVLRIVRWSAETVCVKCEKRVCESRSQYCATLAVVTGTLLPLGSRSTDTRWPNLHVPQPVGVLIEGGCRGGGQGMWFAHVSFGVEHRCKGVRKGYAASIVSAGDSTVPHWLL